MVEYSAPDERPTMPHDPEFPFTVVYRGEVIAKFKTASDAAIFAERILADVVETRPDAQ